jgi:hypothetical protein
MSFLQKARQAAEQAAEQARQAAERATHAASEGAQKASATLSDPATAEKARQAIGRAKRGISTAIDRIDPGVLADIIIKATALQERANAALRAKGSVYRISQVEIGAAIPPSITFAISRIEDAGERLSGQERSSADLVAAGSAGDGAEPVLALDGSEVAEEPGDKGTEGAAGS